MQRGERVDVVFRALNAYAFSEREPATMERVAINGNVVVRFLWYDFLMEVPPVDVVEPYASA